jgi:hypothetical protein
MTLWPSTIRIWALIRRELTLLPKVEPGRSLFRYLPHPLILILIVLVLVPLVLPFGSRKK